jgi:hypothetical protein
MSCIFRGIMQVDLFSNDSVLDDRYNAMLFIPMDAGIQLLLQIGICQRISCKAVVFADVKHRQD